MKHLWILMIAAVLTLAGCSGKDSNIQPPHALTDITPTVQVNRLWWARVGDGAENSGVRMRPAYADGVIYAASVDGQLRAMDAKTGRTLWKHTRKPHSKADTAYSGGPSVANGLLVICTFDGHVDGLDAKTGKQRWSASLGAEVISAPAIAGNRVIVRTNDGHVHEINATDGSVGWLYDRGSVPLLSLRGNGPLLVANGVVFFGSDDGKLIALRLSDGASLWEQTVSQGEGRTDVDQLDDSDGSLALDGTTLYVGAYHGRLMAINAPSGRPLWNHKLSTYDGIDVGGTTVVAVDDKSDVWAFDASTGDSLWKQDKLKWRWLTTPAVQGTHVVFGDIEGYVQWLTLADGKLAARERLSKDPIRSQPLVVGNIVYVEDTHGHISAYQVGATAVK